MCESSRAVRGVGDVLPTHLVRPTRDEQIARTGQAQSRRRAQRLPPVGTSQGAARSEPSSVNRESAQRESTGAMPSSAVPSDRLRQLLPRHRPSFDEHAFEDLRRACRSAGSHARLAQLRSAPPKRFVVQHPLDLAAQRGRIQLLR